MRWVEGAVWRVEGEVLRVEDEVLRVESGSWTVVGGESKVEVTGLLRIIRQGSLCDWRLSHEERHLPRRSVSLPMRSSHREGVLPTSATGLGNMDGIVDN